ncbi:MAG: hypothetical protein AAF526_00630 [Pseudomonadota bacterium]
MPTTIAFCAIICTHALPARAEINLHVSLGERCVSSTPTQKWPQPTDISFNTATQPKVFNLVAGILIPIAVNTVFNYAGSLINEESSAETEIASIGVDTQFYYASPGGAVDQRDPKKDLTPELLVNPAVQCLFVLLSDDRLQRDIGQIDFFASRFTDRATDTGDSSRLSRAIKDRFSEITEPAAYMEFDITLDKVGNVASSTLLDQPRYWKLTPRIVYVAKNPSNRKLTPIIEVAANLPESEASVDVAKWVLDLSPFADDGYQYPVLKGGDAAADEYYPLDWRLQFSYFPLPSLTTTEAAWFADLRSAITGLQTDAREMLIQDKLKENSCAKAILSIDDALAKEVTAAKAIAVGAAAELAILGSDVNYTPSIPNFNAETCEEELETPLSSSARVVSTAEVAIVDLERAIARSEAIAGYRTRIIETRRLRDILEKNLAVERRKIENETPTAEFEAAILKEIENDSSLLNRITALSGGVPLRKIAFTVNAAVTTEPSKFLAALGSALTGAVATGVGATIAGEIVTTNAERSAVVLAEATAQSGGLTAIAEFEAARAAADAAPADASLRAAAQAKLALARGNCRSLGIAGLGVDACDTLPSRYPF